MSPLAKNEKGAQLAKGRARIIEHKKNRHQIATIMQSVAGLLIRKVCQLIIYVHIYVMHSRLKY